MPQTEEATVPRDRVKAIEHRAEVPSLEMLQHNRRELMKTLAPLRARFGGSRGQGSPSDSLRKRHRSLIMTRIANKMRVESGAMGKEPSETALERMANADIEHIDFCEKLELECTRYELMENDLQDIREQIQSRAEELRAYTGELYLQRG